MPRLSARSDEKEAGGTPASYHERVKTEKREAVVSAALEAFLERGYAGCSLQQIAAQAGVSKATLYKRFPTKAALFEAIVPKLWTVVSNPKINVPVGKPRDGLRMFGEELASMARHPKMLAFYRVLISESMRFPELGRGLIDRGKNPYQNNIARYLEIESQSGNLMGWNSARAASQFFGMIVDRLFWPVIVAPEYIIDDREAVAAVEEASATILARYAQEANALGRTRTGGLIVSDD
jgi:lambda repressor-like predicted transcriptional regulator